MYNYNITIDYAVSYNVVMPINSVKHQRLSDIFLLFFYQLYQT